MSRLVLALGLLISLSACSQDKPSQKNEKVEYSYNLSDEEWKQRLSDEEYRVLREKGTEPRGSIKFKGIEGNGVFLCNACGDTLFHKKHKYESGSGWPAFYDIYEEGKVKEISDYSYGMVRTEVVCGRCGSHLGHVFNDGPKPTGLRYCINAVCLEYEK